MVVVAGLVWDDWNKEHIAKHGISVEEVEEVCHGNPQVIEKDYFCLEKQNLEN